MSLCTYTIELDGNEIDLTIEYDACYQPAKISGPQENCYPDESELNITDITFELNDDYTVTEEQVIEFISSPIIQEKLEEACWEDYMAQGDDDRY